MKPLYFSNTLPSAVDPVALERFENIRENMLRQYTEFVEKTFRDAIVAHVGYMPDMATVMCRGHIYITQDGTQHLAWLDARPALGDKMDATTVIASVAPPRFNINTP